MKDFFVNAIALKDVFISETVNTIYMLLVTAIISGAIGLFLGVILVLTGNRGIKENIKFYSILDKIINFFRAIPFIILIAIIAPVTRFLIGTTIGENAAIVPLIFGTVPFFAKQVETALHSVEDGVIEAAQAMGCTTSEIVLRVYLREALPSLIRVSSITLISLIGLTAMAGVVGAGGLGKVAISMGHQRFKDDVTLVATVLILVFVYGIQGIGNILVKKFSH